MSDARSVYRPAIEASRFVWSKRVMSNHAASHIRRIAHVWMVVALLVFGMLAIRDGVPTNPELGEWQQPVQLVLLAAIAIGGILAVRWVALGASVITAGAIALGVLSTVENTPELAFLAALVFLVPGVLHWLVWQQEKRLRAVVLLALAMTTLLAAGGYVAAGVYDHLFGPTHPQSATKSEPVDLAKWIWAGGTTHESARVTARLAGDHTAVKLAVSTDESFEEFALFDGMPPTDRANQHIVTFDVQNLEADTRYFYAIFADDRLDRGRRGEFRTFPQGAATFRFVFSACARTGSNGQVFDAIREADPLFYMNIGDIHYTYIDEVAMGRYEEEYDRFLTRPAQAALYQSTSSVYVWDDHDYGPNDGDGTAPTRDIATRAYRQHVPHYELPSPQGATGPIYQAFSAGRVRFILTDTRSERDPNTDVDDAEKSMLGDEQKAWLKQELLAANGRFPLIVWVSSVPWIDEAGENKDT
ncbi:MAG: alkaline phosphatase D family protein, partial [Chloroflexota bacterium]